MFFVFSSVVSGPIQGALGKEPELNGKISQIGGQTRAITDGTEKSSATGLSPRRANGLQPSKCSSLGTRKIRQINPLVKRHFLNNSACDSRFNLRCHFWVRGDC